MAKRDTETTERTLRSNGRAVSMSDVAEAAGVSQQTVSRVVNGLPNVSDKTRERVLNAMRRLGFRPNFAGRSLRAGRYRTVGFCTANMGRVGNFATLEGIMCAARTRGYAVTMIDMGSEAAFSLADASARMAELPVDGIVINVSRPAIDFDTFSPLPGLSTVLLTTSAHPRCTTLNFDQYRSSREAVAHLVALGHRQIRFIGGEEGSSAARCRERAWRDELAAHGLEVREPYQGDWSASSGFAAGERIACDTESTAVFSANDQMAYGAMLALQSRGISVPGDMSIIGIDDSLGEMVPYSELSTVRFDWDAYGDAIFAHAIDEDGCNVEPHEVRLPGELVLRASVAPV